MRFSQAIAITWIGEPAIKLVAGGYEAVIIPGVGANCILLRNSGWGADILRTPPDSAALRSNPYNYGMPFLFPPNRIRGGRFIYESREYSFPINEPQRGNFIHGFLMCCPFSVQELQANSEQARAVLCFSPDEQSGYYCDFPNHFAAKVEYVLSEAGLSHTAIIQNRSDFPLPLGIGFHTAFRVPFLTGGKPENYRLMASVNECWPIAIESTATPLGYPQTDPFTRMALRENGALPLSSLPPHWSMQPMTYGNRPFQGAVLRDSFIGTDLVYEVDPPYRFWVFWNDGGNKDFICIEPQTWMIDAPHNALPNKVSGFIPIPAKDNLTCQSRISLEKIKSEPRW